MQDLSRHTAVITGASSGIGAGIAHCLAARGAKLVLAARRADRLQALARDLDIGDRVLIRPTDVTKEEEVAGLFADAEAFSPVTLLVTNAGVARFGPPTEVTLDQWRAVTQVNLDAAFLCCREALRVMQPRKRGRIINIGSLCAQMPRPNTVAYTASKFGLEGLTRSLALDSRDHGITVSIIHPGSTISELAGDGGGRSRSSTTMEAADVAEVVATMAAMPDEINFLTATMLPVAQPYLGRG